MEIIQRKPLPCVRCGIEAKLDRAGYCELCQYEQVTGKVFINWDTLYLSARVNDKVQGITTLY